MSIPRLRRRPQVPQPQNVCLVHPDRPEYREFCRRARSRSETNHPRDPLAREYHSQLLRWEEIVRVILAGAVSSSSQERILMFHNRIGLRQRLSFLELDFVAGCPSQPSLFVEIKLRERTINPELGRLQLRRSLGIARSRWPNLQGLNVCVAMGGLLQTEVACNVPVVPLPQLPEHLETKTTDDGEVIWLDGSEIAEHAVNTQLLTSDCIRQLPELRLDMLHPTRILERRVADPDENSCASPDCWSPLFRLPCSATENGR